MATKLIAVVGGTGAQGGSVLKALLNSKKWNLRTMTRDVNSPAAKALASQGVQVIQGDLDDKASINTLLNGAYGAYLVTSINPSKPDGELQQGKNFADVAKELKVQHVVFSSLEDVQKLTGGKYEVPHFDYKNRVGEYFKSLHVPLTEVALAMYMENFTTFFKPRLNKDGVYEIVLPIADKAVDLVYAKGDTGGIVSWVFDNPSESLGKYYGIAGDSLTGEQIASTYERVTGKKTKFVPVPVEAFKKFGFPMAEELGNMFQFYIDFAGKIRDVNKSKQMNPNMTSWEKYLKEVLVPSETQN